MAKSTKTKQTKAVNQEKVQKLNSKLISPLGGIISFIDATTSRINFKNTIPPNVYRDYITYTIAELRDFINNAEVELVALNVEEEKRAIAIFPLIDALYGNKISVGFTSCAIVEKKDKTLEFKHQFNTYLDDEQTIPNPNNPFNGNGNDLDAYNHGQGYPFIPTPKKKK